MSATAMALHQYRELQTFHMYVISVTLWCQFPEPRTASSLCPVQERYRSNLARRRGIAFDTGTQDFNPALLVQAHDLDAALTSNGIPHGFEEFTGTHTDK